MFGIDNTDFWPVFIGFVGLAYILLVFLIPVFIFQIRDAVKKIRAQGGQALDAERRINEELRDINSNICRLVAAIEEKKPKPAGNEPVVGELGKEHEQTWGGKVTQKEKYRLGE